MAVEARRGAALNCARSLTQWLAVLSATAVIAAALFGGPTRAAAQATPTPGATPAAKAKAAKQAKPAAHAKQKAKERVIPLSMTKGQTYIIDGVAKTGSPAIKVVDNPNALVVRTDMPGRIVLVGADAGTWKLNVTLDTGEKVIYRVSVSSIAPPQGSLEPGAAPTVMP